MTSLNEIRRQVENCSGRVGAGTTLFDYWEENDCPQAYSDFINWTDGNLAYNPDRQATAQNDVVDLFNTYFETNTLTDDVTSPEYNNFQNSLLSLCIDPTLPGICGEFLDSYCAQFSREQAINSPTLTNFCGCYVPPDPLYLELTTPANCTGPTGCTGNAACDPLCRPAQTSKRAIDETGEILTCPLNVCVIDDVVINAQQTNIEGGINFYSVCAGCGGASGGDGCLCIVAGVDVSATMSNVGVGDNFDQFCGSNSICVVEDDNGNVVSQEQCSNFQFGQIPVGAQNVPPDWGIILIIVLFLVIVVIIILIVQFTGPRVKYPSMMTET
jgi:hypothetical protein